MRQSVSGEVFFSPAAPHMWSQTIILGRFSISNLTVTRLSTSPRERWDNKTKYYVGFLER